MSKADPSDFEITEENKDDFKKSVISRSNLVNTFTLEDVEKHRQDLEQTKKKLDAQIKVSQAVLDNIERNHAFVKKMGEEKRTIVAYYQENSDVLKDAKSKLEDVEESMKSYDEVIDLVYDKFGFVKSNINTDEKDNTGDKEE